VSGICLEDRLDFGLVRTDRISKPVCRFAQLLRRNPSNILMLQSVRDECENSISLQLPYSIENFRLALSFCHKASPGMAVAVKARLGLDLFLGDTWPKSCYRNAHFPPLSTDSPMKTVR